MSNLYRLRIELSPEKGALGRLGKALESVGGSIITIDLQDIDSERAVDDLVVSFSETHPTPTVIDDVLTEQNAGRLRHWAPVEEAIDPVLRSIRWATAIYSAGAGFLEEELVRVIAEICGSTDAWMLHDDAIGDVAIASAAYAKHGPVADEAGELPAGLHASFAGPASLVAVPDAALSPDGIVVVARPAGQTFSANEIQRISAVLAVYRQARTVHGPSKARTDSGPWFDVSNA